MLRTLSSPSWHRLCQCRLLATKAGPVQLSKTGAPAKLGRPGISRQEMYPAPYHMGLFPWLLSAERQRVPADDLDAHASAAQEGKHHWASTGSRLASHVIHLAPLPVRRRLAHELNMHIARAALGGPAIDGVCRGAELALRRVAGLLSSASLGGSGGQEAEGELAQVLSRSLMARYLGDLRRLRSDRVQLSLDIAGIHGARIRQLRTQSGPADALAALESAVTGGPKGSALLPRLSTLRASLAQQSYSFSRTLGAVRAAPAVPPECNEPGEAVRVRVDVELNVDMRYRLIGGRVTPKVIVDDNAARNLMLTLESTWQERGSQLEWRVADIDYLLSSELRIQQEFEEAHSAC